MRRPRKVLLMRLLTPLLIVTCVAVATASGQQQSVGRSNKGACKGSPKLVGECFEIHGRAFASNGTPDLRIWRVGTNRILGVTASAIADDAEDPIAPDDLFRALDGDKHFVFGDFEVCPFTPEREDHMQMVCIERADNLVIKPYGFGSKR